MSITRARRGILMAEWPFVVAVNKTNVSVWHDAQLIKKAPQLILFLSLILLVLHGFAG